MYLERFVHGSELHHFRKEARSRVSPRHLDLPIEVNSSKQLWEEKNLNNDHKNQHSNSEDDFWGGLEKGAEVRGG